MRFATTVKHSQLLIPFKANRSLFYFSKLSFSMSSKDQVSKSIESSIKNNKVMVFSKTTCPYCAKAKATLRNMKVDFGLIEVDQIQEGEEIKEQLKALTGHKTLPCIFVNGKFLGGCDSLLAVIESGTFHKMLSVSTASEMKEK